MSIPEAQLQTWSHQGALTTAAQTFASIEQALSSHSWPDGIRREIYLQGSYKNTTNIRGDSDVDVVIQLDSVFYSNLTEEQKRRRGWSRGRYAFCDFRPEVLRALRNYYGHSAVREGNKSLKITSNRLRLSADVVPCVQYRHYVDPDNNNSYVEGICFWTREDSRPVVNYPKVHYENGVFKHQTTNNVYKATVRMLKNARSRLVASGVVSEQLAPSYFVECMCWNIPNTCFSANRQRTFCDAVRWLACNDFRTLKCQNGQVSLFGHTPEQWTTEAATEFTQKLAWLWENYR